MKINKSLDIDLNIISPQRNIQIHEGDIDSIDIVLAVSVDDVSLDLTGLTIKYDATINNYLAEQDANGSVVENKIVIPVTENMTAMPGLLLVDVRMIQGGEILFTRTIRATVERAVVNGSTYIDFSKITIVQRMNALEEQMAHVEEIVDGLDTSKQITSSYRPPQTAPATVDVDFFRVGDTWIYQDSGIVYKLIGADYNYQLGPMIPAVHKFRWQPLNEYFSYGIVEPPTSATYTPIGYVIGELTFNALPVPEYFIGDTYARVISGAVKTLFTLADSAEVSAGQYTFGWHENGGGDADNKMDLAPINPTAQEIEDMPSGQLYSDTVNHKGVIKGGQEFYDSVYIDENYRKTYKSRHNPPIFVPKNEQETAEDSIFKTGDRWINSSGSEGTGVYVLRRITSGINRFQYKWVPEYEIWYRNTSGDAPHSVQRIDEVQYQQGVRGWYETPHYLEGIVLYEASEEWGGTIQKIYKCYATVVSGYQLLTYWAEISVPENYYTKSEIDSMIGDIETALSEV